MAVWRVARSLETLRLQINKAAPSRSTASDGAIGDPAHATRVSDHNPQRFPWADRALVLARDFTHDPGGGLDCQKLYLALLDGRDQRVSYIIWRGQITSGGGGHKPWQARPYSGANPHDKHLHLSVVRDARADLGIPWILRLTIPVIPGNQVDSSRFPVLRHGDRSEDVRRLQAFLIRAFPSYIQFQATGFYGDNTKAAIKEFQRRAGVRGSPLDGSICGPATNYALAEFGYNPLKA